MTSFVFDDRLEHPDNRYVLMHFGVRDGRRRHPLDALGHLAYYGVYAVAKFPSVCNEVNDTQHSSNRRSASIGAGRSPACDGLGSASTEVGTSSLKTSGNNTKKSSSALPENLCVSNELEYLYHPANFRTKMCPLGGKCGQQAVCCYAHSKKHLRKKIARKYEYREEKQIEGAESQNPNPNRFENETPNWRFVSLSCLEEGRQADFLRELASPDAAALQIGSLDATQFSTALQLSPDAHVQGSDVFVPNSYAEGVRLSLPTISPPAKMSRPATISSATVSPPARSPGGVNRINDNLIGSILDSYGQIPNLDELINMLNDNILNNNANGNMGFNILNQNGIDMNSALNENAEVLNSALGADDGESNRNPFDLNPLNRLNNLDLRSLLGDQSNNNLPNSLPSTVPKTNATANTGSTTTILSSPQLQNDIIGNIMDSITSDVQNNSAQTNMQMGAMQSNEQTNSIANTLQNLQNHFQMQNTMHTTSNANDIPKAIALGVPVENPVTFINLHETTVDSFDPRCIYYYEGNFFHVANDNTSSNSSQKYDDIKLSNASINDLENSSSNLLDTTLSNTNIFGSSNSLSDYNRISNQSISNEPSLSLGSDDDLKSRLDAGSGGLNGNTGDQPMKSALNDIFGSTNFLPDGLLGLLNNMPLQVRNTKGLNPTLNPFQTPFQNGVNAFQNSYVEPNRATTNNGFSNKGDDQANGFPSNGINDEHVVRNNEVQFSSLPCVDTSGRILSCPTKNLGSQDDNNVFEHNDTTVQNDTIVESTMYDGTMRLTMNERGHQDDKSLLSSLSNETETPPIIDSTTPPAGESSSISISPGTDEETTENERNVLGFESHAFDDSQFGNDTQSLSGALVDNVARERGGAVNPELLAKLLTERLDESPSGDAQTWW